MELGGTVLNYIINNKEWLFSGIGCSFVTTLITKVIRSIFWKKTSQESCKIPQISIINVDSNVGKNKININIMGDISFCFVVFFISLIVFLFLFSFYFRPGTIFSKDVNQLLKDAEQSYYCGDYLQTAQIYQNDTLQHNDIAINNLGYLFSRGLGVAQDLKIGKEYYYKAAQMGNNIAAKNYIISVLSAPSSYVEILDTLKSGHDEEDTIVDSFVENMMLNLNVVGKYGIVGKEGFWNFTDEDKISCLHLITVEDKLKIRDNTVNDYSSDFVGDYRSLPRQIFICYRDEYFMHGIKKYRFMELSIRHGINHINYCIQIY